MAGQRCLRWILSVGLAAMVVAVWGPVAEGGRPPNWAERAAKAIERVDDPLERAQLHAALAKLHALRGDLAGYEAELAAAEKALENLDEAPDPSPIAEARAYAFWRLVRQLTLRGKFDQAEAVAERHIRLHATDPEAARRTFERVLAGALAEAGEMDAAVAIAEKADDAAHRANILKDVAQTLARLGNPEQAEQIADMLPADDRWGRRTSTHRDVYRWIVQAYIDADKDERAEALIQSDVFTDSSRGRFYLNLARRQAERGNMEAAYRTVEKIPDGLRRMHHPPEFPRLQALQLVGETQLARGDFGGALETAARIEGPVQALLMAKIVEAKAKAGKVEAARKLFHQVGTGRPLYSVSMTQERAARAVIAAMVEAGEIQQAAAIARSQQTPLPLLLEIVYRAIDAGHNDEARALVEQLRAQPDEAIDWSLDGRPGPRLHEQLDRLSERLEGTAGLNRRIKSLEQRAESLRPDHPRRKYVFTELFVLYVETGRLQQAGKTMEALEDHLPSWGIGPPIAVGLEKVLDDGTVEDALTLTMALPENRRDALLSHLAWRHRETADVDEILGKIESLSPANQARIYVELAEKAAQ